DLVDRRLSRDADRRQRVIDAPHRAEQPYERGGRADGGQKGEAILSAALHVVDRALDRHRDPGVDVDIALQSAVLARGLEPGFRDEAVGAIGLQAIGALAYRGRAPELLVRRTRLPAHLVLLIYLGDDDVPASQRHDDQDRDGGPGDDVAAPPHRLEAIGILDDFG